MDKTNLDQVIEHFKKELGNLRTGRAMPTLIENVLIDSYGAKMPLSQLATISAPEPRTLVIQPWDKNNAKAIEKGIQMSGLDLNPIITENVIRINFPPLTEEKRKELVKIMNQKGEEAKVGIRNVREEIFKEIKNNEKESLISEDERFRLEKDWQKIFDEYQKKVSDMCEKKEKELLTV